jgi:hypothetical protein
MDAALEDELQSRRCTAAADIFSLSKSGICWLRFLAIYLEWVNNKISHAVPCQIIQSRKT